jgi:serine protease Do
MVMLHRRLIVLAVLIFSVCASQLLGEDRDQKVKRDLEKALAEGRWIYNDLPRGFEEARETGKPLLVVIRCIPCEACRGFDEQVGSFDPRIDKLLDSFVRVRVPQANTLDLSLFQFDFDLSFYAFFLNTDRTVYGRFGARSTQEDKTGEVSVEAFREAMAAVLKLHQSYPQVRESLRAKTGAAPRLGTPLEYPNLKERYGPKLNYEGKVTASCIHCHQIREAERLLLRSSGQPLPEKVLFPWPLPDVFGMQLDPRKRAQVARIETGSVAERAGFRAGDELISLEGQPLISIADVSWVLEQAGEEGKLAARVRRGEEELALAIPLEKGWRKKSDISWRVSTWDLRRQATGGLLLEGLPAEERASAGIGPASLALRVKHAGEYGEHALAKNAGVNKGDIIIALDGRSDSLRETDFIAHSLLEKRPGDRLDLTVLRGGEKKDLSFKLPGERDRKPAWKHLSSKTGELPPPNGGTQQTASLVVDVDKDGLNDIVLTERTRGPSVVWLKRAPGGWKRYLIDGSKLTIEAGGAAEDIDGDGDLDLIFGGDWQSNEIWWWENPYPAYDPETPWKRHLIKSSGATQHHDQLIGDFLGEKRPQLVSWNQGAGELLCFRIPADPRADRPWSPLVVAKGVAGGEGLAMGDIDGDGRLDIVGAGRWFEHLAGDTFAEHVIDLAQTKGRAAVGDLKKGGLPEVVMVIGDGVGRLKWYECHGDPRTAGSWEPHELRTTDVIHGHSLQVADIDGDGNLDIFCAEMAKWTESRTAPDHPEAKAWIFYGDGKGNFEKSEFAREIGFHEAKVADLDGDRRLDILDKPYNWETPRIDIWLQTR